MLDITIVLLAYGGVRLYEKIKQAKAKKGQKAIAAKGPDAITWLSAKKNLKEFKCD